MTHVPLQLLSGDEMLQHAARNIFRGILSHDSRLRSQIAQRKALVTEDTSLVDLLAELDGASLVEEIFVLGVWGRCRQPHICPVVDRPREFVRQAVI